MPISVHLDGLDAMQRELERIARRAVPFAARETVNGLAFAGRAAWQDEMRQTLTLRNRYTERSIRVEAARTLRMDQMEARLGHPEPYVRLLEFGGREKASRRFRAVPTEIAARQTFGSLGGGRKAAVAPRAVITKLGDLRVPGAASRGRKANNARSIRAALKSGKRLAVLDLGKGKGIYRVVGGKRKPRIQKLYDVSRRSTPVPRRPTLGPALERALRVGPTIAFAALTKQLSRARASGGA